MSVILVISIAIRLAALGLSIHLIRQLRDWRMAFLTAMLALMAARQTLTLVSDMESWELSLTGHAVEIPGLAVSIFVFLFVFCLRDMILAYKAAESGREYATTGLSRFRAALDASADCVFLVDPTSLYFIDCNRTVERALGYRREEALNMAVHDLCPECSAEMLRERFSRILPPGTGDTLVTSCRCKDGGEIPVEVLLNPFKEAHGTVLIAVVRDISERQKSEQLIRQSEQRLAESQRIAHVGTWDWDIVNDALSWTDEIYRIFGLVPQAFGATYETFLERVHPDDRERVTRAVDMATNGRAPYGLDHRIVLPDGTIKTVNEQGKVFFSDAGKPLRMLGTVQDITERVRVMNELQMHRDRLEELVAKRTLELESTNKELEAFSYSVSHDLRAPLRAVDGFGQAMLEDCGERLDKTGRNYLKRIRNATHHMGDLIDDLLTLSRVTRRDMRRETVDLSALVGQIVDRTRESQPDREVTVTIQEGINAQGDPRLLGAALENLIGNAFKFTGHTPDARVELGMTERDGEPVYFIRDNGVGFDMRYADKLFGAFQRLHGAREFPGTGIGLATVQRIIHRHGGDVWAEAKAGEGAAFFFTLPATTEACRALGEKSGDEVYG